MNSDHEFPFGRWLMAILYWFHFCTLKPWVCQSTASGYVNQMELYRLDGNCLEFLLYHCVERIDYRNFFTNCEHPNQVDLWKPRKFDQNHRWNYFLLFLWYKTFLISIRSNSTPKQFISLPLEISFSCRCRHVRKSYLFTISWVWSRLTIW